MTTLEYIVKKYNINLNQNELPIEIPNVSRSTLAEWFGELDFKKGVEIGVAAGEYSLEIMQKNPQIHLTGVDPYLPYVEYRDYMKQSTFDKLESQTRSKLDKYPNYVLLKKTSMESLNDFKDESLCAVYIDGNHQDPFVSEDINGWYKKVRKGGILAGHDYVKQGGLRCDVISAINKFTKDNNIDPWFVLGRRAKREGMIRDTSRSWMIIK